MHLSTLPDGPCHRCQPPTFNCQPPTKMSVIKCQPPSWAVQKCQPPCQHWRRHRYTPMHSHWPMRAHLSPLPSVCQPPPQKCAHKKCQPPLLTSHLIPPLIYPRLDHPSALPGCVHHTPPSLGHSLSPHPVVHPLTTPPPPSPRSHDTSSHPNTSSVHSCGLP